MISEPVRQAIRRAYWATWPMLNAGRVRWFTTRVRWSALLRHASVDLDVAPDVQLGRRVRVDLVPGTRSRLILRPGSRVQDDVLLWLRGGTIEIGSRSALRRGARLNSSGLLRVGADVIVSWGAVLHCAERLEIGDETLVGEYATLIDSDHRRTRDQPMLHHVRSRPVVIGVSAWIGASAVVTPGVVVGDRSVVAARAVLTTDLPDQWLAAGIPARLVRELELDEEVGDL